MRGGQRTDFHHFCFSHDPALNCSARVYEFVTPLPPPPPPPAPAPAPAPAVRPGTLQHAQQDPRGFLIYQYVDLYGVALADVEAVIEMMDGDLDKADGHLYLTKVQGQSTSHFAPAAPPPPPLPVENEMDPVEPMETEEPRPPEPPLERPPPAKPQHRFITHEESKRAAATCYRLWKHHLPRPRNSGGFSGDLEKMKLLSPNPPIITLPAPETLARMALAEATLTPNSTAADIQSERSPCTHACTHACVWNSSPPSSLLPSAPS